MKYMKGLKGLPVTPAIEQEIGIVWQKGRYINSRVEKFLSFAQRYVP